MVTTLNDYDIEVLEQLVEERNEVVRKILKSGELVSNKAKQAYSTELAENVVLIAKLRAK